ncbi:uncharacterized protein LOC100826026 [Brachypodium distachyon]|uniref:Uncharacterized protein n=1 Tax=Brachypodium distachyon TaxID=15368 RepID=A0A0Q3MH67_BRADI|nr:uncharacterized protein LOC100826026 [Brachypodium distachyon]KQK03790.1 hypothetical protein BRADI_2g09876v3 [Brachypodium distachyon]|eukprot:XP_014755163.1 uncharacterized protein LOC100826026 [Brachypodium distachyon]
MASIVLLLSELLGGAGSNGVLAANCYAGGQSLREFRPVAAAVVAKDEPAAAAGKREAAAAPEDKRKEEQEESFEDLAAMSRIAVDVMWP